MTGSRPLGSGGRLFSHTGQGGVSALERQLPLQAPLPMSCGVANSRILFH